MIANNASRILRPVTRNVMQKRFFEPNTVVSGPPTVHVSNAEKVLWGTVMVASWAAIPIYVLTNIKTWRAGSK